MVRQGLATYLRTYDDLEIVGGAANGSEALDLCSEARPDVVVLDMHMPEMDGVEATLAITRLYPDVRVIVLSQQNDSRVIQEVMQAGASNYLVKDGYAQGVLDAIRSAHHRE
jgi:NarL family two-component system response regulator LiaR